MINAAHRSSWCPDLLTITNIKISRTARPLEDTMLLNFLQWIDQYSIRPLACRWSQLLDNMLNII